LSALAPNAQLPCFPVDVIEFEKRRLTCAQAQSGEQEQDGVIAAAQWSGAVDAVQQLPDLIRRDRSRDCCHRPIGHDWNRGAQIKFQLAVVTGKSEERAQSAGQQFRPFGMQTPSLALHKSHDVVRAQLGPHHRAGPETRLKETEDEWNIVDDRGP
jgi:hypothetical protein